MMYSPAELRGFGSGEMRTQSPGYIVATIQVDEAVVPEVPIRVMSDDAQTTEVIVRRTFTEAENVIYAKQGDSLTFKSNYLEESSIPDTGDSTLQITSDNIIPAMSIQMIEMTIGEDSKEPLLLPVMNIQREASTLKKGNMIKKS